MPDVTRAPLAHHTTLRLGGVARRLVTAVDEGELIHLVRESRTAAEPVLILAGGSNVVIADEGFPGTAILMRTTGIDLTRSDDGASTLTVAAGQPWDDVAALTVAEGLAGVECLAGIPGSAGATPIQNVGAYGQEVAETVVAVRAYDAERDEVVTLSPAECGFTFRSSVFKHRDRHVVLSVTFRLTQTPHSAPIRYQELARALDVPVGARAPLAEVRAAVLALRAGKGMVLDPVDRDTYSVGSFFVNPILDVGAYANLRARALNLTGAEPPAWPGPDGTVKTSAAWLIERAGFDKGYSGDHPGVAISTKHSLALTNRGEGTTAALLDLARDVRDGVRKAFEVELRPEPVLVNCAL